MSDKPQNWKSSKDFLEFMLNAKKDPPPKEPNWWMDNQRREKRIRRLYKKGYSPDGIAKMTGYNLGYVRRVALRKKS